MKKLMGKLSPLVAVVAVAVVVIACNKDAQSKPNFIFKPAPSKEIVASMGGQPVLEKDLVKGIESDLYEAELKVYEIKYAKLQSMLLERFMNQDPDKKNLTNDEFLDKFIAKNVKITDAQVEAFIKERQIPKDQINPEIKARIVEYLTVESKKVAVDNWIAEKTKKTPVEIYIQKPSLPMFEVNVGDAPFKGGSDAKVTIVEFSDFQCPFCSKGAQVLSAIEKKYGNKVKIAFKHYPLPFHAQARIAAEASMCANEQDTKLFWKMHDAMFADQSKLDKDNLIATAKKAGVKEAEFKACLESGKFKAKVDANVAEGGVIGIKSTPTFFINGKLISGAQPLEVFSEVIDSELAK
ncbi:thioredoxin domain-containing protein [Bacteriovorax sp. PP10]|uniref:Thioredoxin domain-containing protein n=1 Tax=Bacteriovorax antarcticus TaxID=3088717 RepID=A0ABU5VXX6_9BACT|nr:thioredoxin domain-containing protein [Bacteriovorax sp. PP10]MEA9357807.1 thioredoxin domain-containing protein [Bacteriovorax sp. PP10]